MSDAIRVTVDVPLSVVKEMCLFPELLDFVRLFCRHCRRPPKPGRLLIGPNEEVQIVALKYPVTLPPLASTPAAQDTVTRRLSVTYTDSAGAGTTSSQDLAKDATEAFFVVPQDVDVTVSLVDIDDAGNASPPATSSFHSVDTIPPDQPGDLSIGAPEEVPD